MDKTIKYFDNRPWRIRSLQRFGYIIECVTNKNDIRWCSVRAWEEASEAVS